MLPSSEGNDSVFIQTNKAYDNTRSDQISTLNGDDEHDAS